MYRNNREEEPIVKKSTPSQWDNLMESSNRWVKLAHEIPWKAYEAKYGSLFTANHMGTPAEQVRMLLGALIIKKKYRFTDRETIEQIIENPYLQYFIGLQAFRGELPFDEFDMAEFQHRLDLETVDAVSKLASEDEPPALKPPETQKRETPAQPTPVRPVEAPKVKSSNILASMDRNRANVEPVPKTRKANVDQDFDIETTSQMPAIKESDFYPEHKAGRSQFAGERHQAQLSKFKENFEKKQMDLEEKLAEFLNRYPWIMDGLIKTKKGAIKALYALQEAWRYLFRKDSIWIRVVLGVFACLVVGFILLIVFLPVPAPRMLAASEVYDTKHRLAATFYSENRRPVKLAEIPQFLRQAVLAVEDHRFYKHRGINPGRILKAAWHDMREGSVAQGGSTITQQLVKNVYLTHERTFSRKFNELLISIKLEYKLSKDEIFELYLNKIYFGHGAYGVKVAAETYFQKELSELNEIEMATLAGLPRGPALFSPYKHPKAARERRNQCLKRMEECGFITPEQYAKYSRTNLSLPGLKTHNNSAPYFMDMLQNEIARIFPDNPQILYTSGVKVESTLDLDMHRAALKAFKNNLPVVFQRRGGIPQPQGALVALNPKNGEIRTLIGGTDYMKSQFNRAIQAKRQPGSAFKPILYATAFSKEYTLTSLFDREPKTYYIGNQTYRPTDSHAGTGKTTLRHALAQSSNVVAVRLLEQVGFKPVIGMAELLGIKSKLKPRLSLALGACEVTPLELAAAYGTLANGGVRYTPTTIRRILDRQGKVLYQRDGKGTQAVDPGVAYITTQAMTEVLRSGTAAAVGAQLNRPAAGKTGTTNSNRDTWFVGFTPDLLACVFVGCDNYERALPGMASQVAAPIWGKFMMAVLNKTPVKDFPVPANVKRQSICTESGLLANEGCSSRSEYFIVGTEPQETCSGRHFRLGEFINGLLNNDDTEENGTEEEVAPKKEPQKEAEPETEKSKGGLSNFFRRIIRKL